MPLQENRTKSGCELYSRQVLHVTATYIRTKGLNSNHNNKCNIILLSSRFSVLSLTIFNTYTYHLEKKKKKKAARKNISEVEHKDGKKESPCGGWTPCPSEPKLGNVTTGLQGDSLNRLENLTLPIYRRNVDLIKSLKLL